MKRIASRASLAGGLLAAFAAHGMDLTGYVSVKLHPGINANLNIGVPAHPATVVIGHRENFNAHGFEVASFFIAGDKPPSLDLMSFWDGDKESLHQITTGGADCLLHDFRLLRSSKGAPAMVAVADREMGESYADKAKVSFRFYRLAQNTEGLPGRPTYSFELVKTEKAKASYCDVGEAFARELGLGSWP